MEEVKNCKNCGALCSLEYKFCPNCGTSLEDSKCSQCGAKLIDGAKFCVYCGASTAEKPEKVIAQKVEETRAEAQNESDVGNQENNVTTVISDAPVHRLTNRADKSINKNYILRLIKNASVFILCVILFALSFCNIVTVKADSYFDFEIDDCEVSLSAVDIIDLMGSTAGGEAAEEKYWEELLEISERLTESLTKDYNATLGKFILSSKSKALISEVTICYLKSELSSEDAKGDPFYNNIIIAGTFCLMNILFSAAMLIVSSISLLSVILKKKNRVSKFLYAMPVYLFISLLILFLVKTTVGVGTVVAGAMGATLFFEIVAIIATVLLVFSATKKKSIKNAIPKLVSVAVSLIICACLFAPVFTAKYDLVLQNKIRHDTYTATVDAGGLITYISPSDAEEYSYPGFQDTYNLFMEQVEDVIESMSEMTTTEFKNSGGEIATRLIMSFLIVAAGNYTLTGILSLGYYILLLAFMLFGAFAVWSIASLFNDDERMYGLIIAIIFIIIIAFACSIGWICVMNYHLEDLVCSFTVGGGLISAIILSIMTLIFTKVFKTVASRERVIDTNREYASVSDNNE